MKLKVSIAALILSFIHFIIPHCLSCALLSFNTTQNQKMDHDELLYTCTAWDFNQEILKYGAPILVAVESLANRTGKDGAEHDAHPAAVVDTPHWIAVLQTTRILIAHATLFLDTSHQTLLRQSIAQNIRNLYLLFGMDVADKKIWCQVDDPLSYTLRPDDRGGEFNPELLLAAMDSLPFAALQASFDEDPDTDRKQLIGHCVYNLVGTRYRQWQKQMCAYRLLKS